MMLKCSLAYYIFFLIFPFQTQTDEEDRAQYVVENRDFSDSETSNGDEKVVGDEKTDILVTTTPVFATMEDGNGNQLSQRALNIV
jgi:hypothetical protein